MSPFRVGDKVRWSPLAQSYILGRDAAWMETGNPTDEDLTKEARAIYTVIVVDDPREERVMLDIPSGHPFLDHLKWTAEYAIEVVSPLEQLALEA